MSIVQQTRHEVIDFYIDPSCPWAWRGSKWIRAVARQIPLTVQWRCFSLKLVNEGSDHPRTAFHSQGLNGLRVLCTIRRSRGNDSFDRVYRAIGEAAHERELELSPPILEHALQREGIDPGVIGDALADGSTLEQVRAEHETAVAAVGGFGVPTIVTQHRKGIFGPVLGVVPQGDSAVTLWTEVRDMIDREGFYELKRRRT